MPHKEQPVLFLWSFSPWSNKVVSYLALRGIPYARCEQPIVLPRPDLEALGVNYRRVPVISLGRDIYCDSLLCIEKLEELYPGSEGGYKALSASGGTEFALEKLLEKWTDVVVFKPAAAVIPTSLDLMKDPAFQKDREELWGRSWSAEAQEALRPAALAEMRACFDFLEKVLGDGRHWILGSNEPKLADIHSCWIFDWLFQLPGAFPDDFFGKQKYPKFHAWRDRYSAAIEKAKEVAPKPTELEGKDAVKQILAAGFVDTSPKVEADPSGLKDGEEVDMYPNDTGYNRKDTGKLIKLTSSEAVISTKSKQDAKELRIHYPRWNFTITPTSRRSETNGHADGQPENGVQPVQ
ncbi:hypothetical protein LTR78_009884 [Recurvomyces mirabilis]|uniref:GST C-terminal domain-containing protein n=1 Tax=Recurvomyces mirabilis TaxID=574656 RepID=A0AAE0TN44_9PEZI|nr:hypothetical protein LTR78_009884 [Recurvomyces mirabilis]KAK5150559.1 hypothetical protein LTS14_010053 [Recurvomyces mirabilis]